MEAAAFPYIECMLNDLFIFAVALFMVIRGATYATRYAALLAESFRLSTYTVGFIIIAVISILPETFISLNAAFQGIPDFGVGMLFGSNVADLTFVFALIVLLAGRSLKVEAMIIKNRAVYPFMLLLPLFLGWNGHFSRLEGLSLIVAGGVFYYLALRDGTDVSRPFLAPKHRLRNATLLLVSMAVMLTGAHFTVSAASALATALGVTPVLIGMLIVGLGTTMPELFFALKAVKKRDDSLAVGDILGTVLADATIVVGLLALVAPFYFPQRIVYVTGIFMVLASFLLFRFMRTEHTLTRREGLLLLAFWLLFVVVEFWANS